MCGFVALYNLSGAPIDRRVLAGMTDVQRHRGPDDQGFAAFSFARQELELDMRAMAPRPFEGGLGFNRLSIRDLSPAGHQPMATPDGKTVIVYNGELYNADDEREALVRRGHVFRGSSDTEVLLAMYREYGLEEALARANGMFAFCLVDLPGRRIFLARDRLGIKPLYYWLGSRVFAAASEAKSFLVHPDFVARLDESNLAEHLAFRSCAGDRHLLRDVRQVEPGQWLELSAGGELRKTRWWRPPSVPTRVWRGRFERAVDEVEAALDRSVRMQLVSDVPVGCQFSGGVDSSLVSAFANRHASRGRYQTFSILVDDPRFNEERWIDVAGRHLGVSGHRFVFGAREFAAHLESAAWHLDEPLDHMNSLGIKLLAEGSKPHVTVLLSGEGADETFCGYPRFLRALLRPALAPLARLPAIGRRLAAFDRSRGADARDWFIRASSPILPRDLAALLGRDCYEEAMEVRRAMFPREGTFTARCRAYELETFLVGLLKRQDKMTMAHSLENRVPLLDHELVELVSSMPPSYCVSRRPAIRPLEHNTKRVLKAVAERHFPRSFVFRRKEGFGMPIGQYLASDALRPLLADVIGSATRRGLFDGRTIRRWSEQLDEPLVAEAMWIVVAFELWARQFLDGARGRLASSQKGESSANGARESAPHR